MPNDSQRSRLSRRHMIWLLFHFTPPPLPSASLSLFLSLPVCRRSSLLTGQGMDEEPNHMTAQRESIVFYESLNTLWLEGKIGRVVCLSL